MIADLWRRAALYYVYIMSKKKRRVSYAAPFRLLQVVRSCARTARGSNARMAESRTPCTLTGYKKRLKPSIKETYYIY